MDWASESIQPGKMSQLEELEDAQQDSDVQSEGLEFNGEEGDDEEVEFESDDEQEKDEAEEELEHLVFGDSAGFRRGLKTLSVEEQLRDATDAQNVTGLESLNDAEVGGPEMGRI